MPDKHDGGGKEMTAHDEIMKKLINKFYDSEALTVAECEDLAASACYLIREEVENLPKFKFESLLGCEGYLCKDVLDLLGGGKT